MTKLTAMVLLASTLGACSTLGGCGRQEVPVSGGPLEGGQRVTVDQARLLSLEPFAGRTRWYAVMAYDRGREVVMLSDPVAAGSPERRLVQIMPGDGYVVSRIRTLCDRGAYAVRDARSAKTDASPPTQPATGSSGLDIRADLTAICAQTAKLPSFDGRVEVAVAKARRLNAGLAIGAEPPSSASELRLKEDPRAPETHVIRLPDRRPQAK